MFVTGSDVQCSDGSAAPDSTGVRVFNHNCSCVVLVEVPDHATQFGNNCGQISGYAPQFAVADSKEDLLSVWVQIQ